MSVLSRAMLSLWYGVPLSPEDSGELGRIFDETVLHGMEKPSE